MGGSPTDRLNALLDRVDRFQQAHGWAGFPFAVVRKFGDDRAGYLAALIAYYGFFSMFPLLMVFVGVLGLVLEGNPALQQQIINSAVASFPVIGEQIKTRVESLTASASLVSIGAIVALWAGLGVAQAAQNAMNEIWDVPRRDRPNFWKSRLRSVGMLALLGTLVVVTTFLSGVATGGGTVGSIGISLILNLGLFMVAFRVLTARDLSWGQVLPGSIFAAILWTFLQTIGGYYVTHQVKNATLVYGVFAIVLGLLAWLYVGAQMTLYAALINVVRAERLWPRTLTGRLPTEADRRALRARAGATAMRPGERIGVELETGEPERPREAERTGDG